MASGLARSAGRGAGSVAARRGDPRRRGERLAPGGGLLRPIGPEGGGAVTTMLLWKEYRQQRATWVALAALAALLVVGIAEALGHGSGWEPFDVKLSSPVCHRRTRMKWDRYSAKHSWNWRTIRWQRNCAGIGRTRFRSSSSRSTWTR